MMKVKISSEDILENSFFKKPKSNLYLQKPRLQKIKIWKNDSSQNDEQEERKSKDKIRSALL